MFSSRGLQCNGCCLRLCVCVLPGCQWGVSLLLRTLYYAAGVYVSKASGVITYKQNLLPVQTRTQLGLGMTPNNTSHP